MDGKENKREEILNSLKWRFATKVFDPRKLASEEDIRTILEAARLSPSADGFEPWKFILVRDPEVRKKIREVGFNQPKITDASHLVVVCYRTSPEKVIKERLERTAKIQNQKVEELQDYRAYLEKAIGSIKDFEAWSKSMTFIPLGIMVAIASLLKVDNGPMSGFNPEKVDGILGLREKNLKSATMITFGYRGDDPLEKKPKVRRDWDDAIEIV